jgi:hypothetical protein
MPHIFISYAKDETGTQALALLDCLQALDGITAWMDKSIEGDESWDETIENEIERCNYMIVLLSPDVNRKSTPQKKRSFVLKEIHYAQQRGIDILPLIVMRTHLPLLLSDVQFIDITQNPTDFSAVIKRLKRKFPQVGEVWGGTQSSITDPPGVNVRAIRQPQTLPDGPPIFYVRGDGSGTHRTITAALNAVQQDNTRILIGPGTYRESLRLTRPVTLECEKPDGKVTIFSSSAPCLEIDTLEALVKNLHFEYEAPYHADRAAIKVLQGMLSLRNCKVVSAACTAVYIGGHHTNPGLIDCTISSSTGSALWCVAQSEGVIQGCKLRGGGNCVVFIDGDADPLFEACDIWGAGRHGVIATKTAGKMKNCTITRNGEHGVVLMSQARLKLLECRITNNGAYGVSIHPEAAGSVEGCTLTGNAYGAFEANQQASTRLINNTIG